MFILQILIGVVAAVGIGFVLADLWKYSVDKSDEGGRKRRQERQ